MLVRFSEIVWDLDEPEDGDGLPLACVLDVSDDVDVSVQGADLLSDKFGFCVRSFQFAGECS
jgi:hypothetical protein